MKTFKQFNESKSRKWEEVTDNFKPQNIHTATFNDHKLKIESPHKKSHGGPGGHHVGYINGRKVSSDSDLGNLKSRLETMTNKGIKENTEINESGQPGQDKWTQIHHHFDNNGDHHKHFVNIKNHRNSNSTYNAEVAVKRGNSWGQVSHYHFRNVASAHKFADHNFADIKEHKHKIPFDKA